jgi:hypothetical protein
VQRIWNRHGMLVATCVQEVSWKECRRSCESDDEKGNPLLIFHLMMYAHTGTRAIEPIPSGEAGKPRQ